MGSYKTRTPEYNSWSSMRHRCYNPASGEFKNYGARGIRVCDRWDSFDQFMNDMGEKPSIKHSLDRIDVNGNYEAANCRWATATQQSRNKRIQRNNKSGVPGVSWDKAHNRWLVTIKVDGIKKHIGRYTDFNEAAKSRSKAQKELWV